MVTSNLIETLCNESLSKRRKSENLEICENNVNCSNFRYLSMVTSSHIVLVVITSNDVAITTAAGDYVTTDTKHGGITGHKYNPCGLAKSKAIVPFQ